MFSIALPLSERWGEGGDCQQMSCTGGDMEQEQQSRDHSHATEPVLALTATAVEMMKQALIQTDVHARGIRLTVTGGGCRGFQYSLTLAEAARPEDVVIRQDGVTAFLDPTSAQHLRGTRLDYVNNHHGTGFHFFGLDAGRSIGCGSAMILRRCIAGNTRTTGCIKSSKRPLLVPCLASSLAVYSGQCFPARGAYARALV
jgi:iron-sulfur cluster assembly accessory protein